MISSVVFPSVSVETCSGCCFDADEDGDREIGTGAGAGAFLGAPEGPATSLDVGIKMTPSSGDNGGSGGGGVFDISFGSIGGRNGARICKDFLGEIFCEAGVGVGLGVGVGSGLRTAGCVLMGNRIADIYHRFLQFQWKC